MSITTLAKVETPCNSVAFLYTKYPQTFIDCWKFTCIRVKLMSRDEVTFHIWEYQGLLSLNVYLSHLCHVEVLNSKENFIIIMINVRNLRYKFNERDRERPLCFFIIFFSLYLLHSARSWKFTAVAEFATQENNSLIW